MIEIELKAFIDVLKASNLTKAKLAHGKARVWLDLDKLTMLYNGQETPLKRQSLNYGGYRYYLYCPNCGEARTSLYWYCEALSCRKCLGLHNRTLNRSKTDCVYYWEQAVKEAQMVKWSKSLVKILIFRNVSKFTNTLKCDNVVIFDKALKLDPVVEFGKGY